MHIVSIFNNKGGVGKSTLTVGIAEFLASNRKKRVLVIDFDAQASSSGSLLGRDSVTGAIRNRRTIAELVRELIRTRTVLSNAPEFFTARSALSAKGTALGRIEVLVPDKEGMIELEERLHTSQDALLLKEYLKPALQDFHYVLIDMPGNVDRRSTLVVGGLIMSDFVLIPIEPNQIALRALPDTFDLIHHARRLGGEGRPAVVGMVLNKTDRRAQQYRSKLPAVLEAANLGELPPVFDNLLPDTPKLATATDETLDFRTLKERFDTYYDNVRKVARELEERCEGRVPLTEPQRVPFGERFRDILDKFAGRNRPRTTTKKAGKRTVSS